jgi:hypothetical protein
LGADLLGSRYSKSAGPDSHLYGSRNVCLACDPRLRDGVGVPCFWTHVYAVGSSRIRSICFAFSRRLPADVGNADAGLLLIDRLITTNAGCSARPTGELHLRSIRPRAIRSHSIRAVLFHRGMECSRHLVVACARAKTPLATTDANDIFIAHERRFHAASLAELLLRHKGIVCNDAMSVDKSTYH